MTWCWLGWWMLWSHRVNPEVIWTQTHASRCPQTSTTSHVDMSHSSNQIQITRGSIKDLRLLVGLLTGHNTLNRHLTLLRRMDDRLCPLCGEQEDTSLHLLGNCCATAEKRYEFFGRYFLGTADLRQEHWSFLLQFAKTSRRFL